VKLLGRWIQMMGEKCPECGGKVVVDPGSGEVVRSLAA